MDFAGQYHTVMAGNKNEDFFGADDTVLILLQATSLPEIPFASISCPTVVKQEVDYTPKIRDHELSNEFLEGLNNNGLSRPIII